jgi:hypothetical protein
MTYQPPAEAANSHVQVWRCGCRYRRMIKDCVCSWVRAAVCAVHEQDKDYADEYPLKPQDPGLTRRRHA